MKRLAAIVLAVPALLLAADSLAQVEEDFPPPPEEYDAPPPEEYEQPSTGTEASDRPRTQTRKRDGKRDGKGERRRRGRSRSSTQRDVAIGIGSLILGEIILAEVVLSQIGNIVILVAGIAFARLLFRGRGGRGPARALPR